MQPTAFLLSPTASLSSEHEDGLHHIFSLPKNVTLSLQETHVLRVEGPLGHIDFHLRQLDPNACCFFSLNQEERTFSIATLRSSRKIRALFGTLRSLFSSAFIGVSRGYLLYLELVGIGYRAQLEEKSFPENKFCAERSALDQSTLASSAPSACAARSSVQQILDVKVGQSHPLHYMPPADVRIFLPRSNSICIYGINKQRVASVAAKIRSLKAPEPYKGKGIRYPHETIILKQGKKK